MKSVLWEGAKKTLQKAAKIIEENPDAKFGDPSIDRLLKVLKDDDVFAQWWKFAVGEGGSFGYISIAAEAMDNGMPAAKAYLQKILGSIAPESFTYQGFVIKNPGQMVEAQARQLLDGVDYLVALFKKRGMSGLLKKGIREIVLNVDNKEAAGLYYSQTQTIELLAAGLRGSGKMLKTWVHEVFLHEFGHYIHLNYITGDAKRFWDSAWDPIQEFKVTREDALAITLADRERYLKVIERSNWNLGKANKSLKGLDQVKMAYWLREAGTGPLIGPKSLRLTELGQRYFGLLQNPRELLQKEGKDPSDITDAYIERRVKVVLSNLYLDSGLTFHVPVAVAQKYMDADPSVGDKALEDMLKEIGGPTDYSRTNETEDFAETWVAFMDNPNLLSDNATYRMKRTLSLSGLGGREVLRLAYDYDRRKC